MKRNAYMLRVAEAVGTMTKVPTGIKALGKRLVFAYRRASQMPHLYKSTQCSSLVDQSGLAAVPRVFMVVTLILQEHSIIVPLKQPMRLIL